MRLHGIAVVLLGASVLVGGCAQIQEGVRDIREMWRKVRGVEPAPPPPVPPRVPAPAPVPPPEPSPGVPAPVPAPSPAPAGLTLNGNCVAKEETGYIENARIEVVGGVVLQLEARIDIPKRGSCTYRLADFRQTQHAPIIELLARSNTACALRMWQQGDRITFVPTDCAEKCTKGAFEYAWPVQFNAAGGCY